ncbi:MAG: hypothetical protein J5522_06245, partial [Lachnospiraceae bacterium]|nr:hypothetical protein [Lachnospiraceae bacterium]
GSDYTAELGTYTISVTAPDGYELVTAGDKTVTVTADTVSSHEEQIRELPHKGALDIKVIDQDSNPVSGVTVKVTEPSGTEKTYTTNADGKVTKYSKSGSDYTAELGTYTISVTAPDGYELVTAGSKTVTVTANNVTTHEEQIRPVPTPKGALDIKVIDQDSNPVSGVEVKVTEPGGTERTFTTDSEGKVTEYSKGSDGEFKAETGTYTIHVTAPNSYELVIPGDKTTVVAADTVSEHVEQLNNLHTTPSTNGGLLIKVYDEVLGRYVEGVTVEVEQPDNTKKTFNTDANGEIREYMQTTTDSLGNTVYVSPIGTYNIKVTQVPDKYTITSGAAVSVEVEADLAKTHVANISYKKGGGLVITVIDEITGLPVKDAKVEVIQPDNTTKILVTDSDGQIKDYSHTVKDVNNDDVYTSPTGTYKITVKEVPEGYTVSDGQVDVNVVTDTKTTHEAKVKTKEGGSLVVVVTDEKTGNPVKGAKIEIVQPDGTVRTLVTDVDGEIKDYDKSVKNISNQDVYTSPVGTYKITVKEVPSGYTVTTGKTQDIVINTGEKKT